MEEFVGDIQLNSGIVPKKGKKFPLLQAQDVLMPDGTRLNAIPYIGGSYKYSDAIAHYDLSENTDKSVMMHLFPSNNGYAAVVSGTGAMKNHELTLHAKGYKVTTEKRDYADYIKKINKVYIESGVTTIGDYFMFGAHNLKEVIFEDSSTIKRLGTYCFAVTQISGEYEFCKLDNETIIDRSFYCCPKLEGITLGVSATEGRKITLSESAFFACINLISFIIDDAANTTVELGKASFWYCTNLEYIELQDSKATANGFNFLIAPYLSGILRRQKTKIAVNGDEIDTVACSALSGAMANWNGYDPADTATSLSTVERWIFTNIGTYSNLTEVKADYNGKRHELPIYTMDVQKKDEYLVDNPHTINMNSKESKAVFWGDLGYGAFRVPFYGSCWLFAYMHIWNVLHPVQQYPTVEEFIEKLKETKITVDESLAAAFAGWDYKESVMVNGRYAADYFGIGKDIYATDLPIDIKSKDTESTFGEVGTASWGVRKVLGWNGTRQTGTESLSWTQIKRNAIESILAGKPVLFECVFYGGSTTTNSSIGGEHAVAGIGYDADTDKFKIIDSTWGFPTEVPMEYWVAFEELLEPSGESAVWVFSEFDDAATINPMQDDPADIINMALWATITCRNEHKYLFRDWTDAVFKPRGVLKPTGTGANEMFSGTKITDLATPLDGIKASLDLSAATQFWNTFASSAITSIPPIDASRCTNMTCAFDKTKVTKLTIRNINADCVFDRTFRYCSALTDLTITGTIGQNGFDVSACPLSHDSLLNILNCLSTDGAGKTVTLGSTNKGKLTEAEQKIATDKGWTLA